MPGLEPIKKVLIVDDERELVEPLALRLTASGGYEVAVAYDGSEGLRKAQIFQPDIAVIDLSMPECDGWELYRRLREDPRTCRTRVVVMTAWVSKDLEKRARREGVEKILLKPFEDADFMAAL